MFYLSIEEAGLIEKALSNLYVRRLAVMWRYAGLQRIEFDLGKLQGGGADASEDDWAIVIGCEWRITGPSQFALGSWNFGRRGRRFDDHAKRFYDKIELAPLTISSLHVDSTGGLSVQMEEEYRLDVNPSVDVPKHGDQWRIIRSAPCEKQEHLVLQGGQLYRSVLENEDPS